MLISISIPKWLSYISCSNCMAKHSGWIIPTIWVESTNLTASYYKEYLGFKIILKNPIKRNCPILIIKNRNVVLIKAINSHNQKKNQRLTLNLRRIDIEYLLLRRKVWVVSPMINNYFLVKDCNGIEIVYNTN